MITKCDHPCYVMTCDHCGKELEGEYSTAHYFDPSDLEELASDCGWDVSTEKHYCEDCDILASAPDEAAGCQNCKRVWWFIDEGDNCPQCGTPRAKL